jgi:hypothetical protein
MYAPWGPITNGEEVPTQIVLHAEPIGSAVVTWWLSSLFFSMALHSACCLPYGWSKQARGALLRVAKRVASISQFKRTPGSKKSSSGQRRARMYLIGAWV